MLHLVGSVLTVLCLKKKSWIESNDQHIFRDLSVYMFSPPSLCPTDSDKYGG